MSQLPSAEDCRNLATQLLLNAGMATDLAQTTATVLVEGDLLGHDTHGLALLPGYLAELESGKMTKSGEPLLLNHRPAAQAWDGRRLPGTWLVTRALDECARMAQTFGQGSVSIRRSHHIACLAAYLDRITAQNLMALIYCSDANSASVAPFGGTTPVFTPNPMAFGIPTGGDPILIDVSCSVTTNGMSNRLAKEGKRFPGKWLLDANGEPSDDPTHGIAGGGGTIQLLGGVDVGHKGYGLTLLVEALTGGLSGHGRADTKEGWGATVFVQVLDPAAFGGMPEMARQMDFLGDACRKSPPRKALQADGFSVRLPGERGLAKKRAQLESGLSLHAAIMPALAPWAQKLGVALPAS